jgi:hypothetical protein
MDMRQQARQRRKAKKTPQVVAASKPYKNYEGNEDRNNNGQAAVTGANCGRAVENSTFSNGGVHV